MPSPICIRVSEEERQTFKEAAARANKTLTRFIKDAAQQAARKVEKMLQATAAHVHGGLPSYIRASIYDASRGGTRSYREVGSQLARHLAGEIPDSAGHEEWQKELDKLSEILDDDRVVLKWFDAHYPRIMAQIPRRRRPQFLEGVRQAEEEELLELQGVIN